MIGVHPVPGRRTSRILCAALLGGSLLLATLAGVRSAIAAPAAGTPIGNQASASYLDASSTSRTATSNLVTTIVQQVASFTLNANGNRIAAPGGQVVFPHSLTNTGNGTDTFPLSLTNLGGDNFDLTGLTIYPDANGDGVPDNYTAINTTGPLVAGDVFQFVVVGNVPGTQIGGDISRVRVNAASAFDGAQTSTNTDVTTVSGNAVISVTKSISQPAGNSPSGPYTYTLSYTNSGNNAATALKLSDAIPAGMTYVAGSARWSVTGAAVLTDASNVDAQGVVPNTVVYDFGVTAGGTMTATINTVPAGGNATLTFNVNVNAGLGPQTINNSSTYSYNDGAGNVGPFTTNLAPFDINQSVSLTFTGQTIAAAVQGATLTYTNTVTNTGNGSDRFDITFGTNTFPAGTNMTLYQSDGVTPLSDSNGNGTPDTGPLAAGGTYAIVLKAMLPPSATGGPYSVQKIATSVSDPSRTATATDVLTTITANAVDVTNNSVGGPGVGAGPEASAVVTLPILPGNTGRFTLFVTNNATLADNFDMAASTDPTFASVTLPAGWGVTFRNVVNAVITNSGNVGATNSVQVFADVTVPAGYVAGTVDLYFRARSPVSLATDRLHDAVSVTAQRGLTLVPNGNGQVTPGGVTTYTHILANTGNVVEGAGTGSVVALTMTNSQGAWGSALYVDSNNNGSFDAGDAAISDLGTLGGIAPGASLRLFVRVFSPAGAPIGQTDLTTLTATTTNGTYITSVPPVVQATDQTTVLNGQLSIVKQQVLDANCDGVPDGAYGGGNITAGANPGVCLRYQIVVTNVGTASVTNVVVDDATPAGTKYSSAVAASVTQGSIVTPANGAAGSVVATIGTIAPNQSVTITFGIRIDP